MSELCHATFSASDLDLRSSVRYNWEDDIEDLDKILYKQQFKMDKMTKYIKKKAWKSKRTISKGHRYE